MDAKQYQETKDALLYSSLRYPNCLIANCECNSKGFVWVKGCHCLCHWNQISRIRKRKYGGTELLDFPNTGYRDEQDWTMMEVAIGTLKSEVTTK